MKDWFLVARIVPFERERDFDLADGKNVHSQPRAQLFEKPIQNEKQWLQRIHRRVQVQVLFELRRKFFGD